MFVLIPPPPHLLPKKWCPLLVPQEAPLLYVCSMFKLILYSLFIPDDVKSSSNCSMLFGVYVSRVMNLWDNKLSLFTKKLTSNLTYVLYRFQIPYVWEVQIGFQRHVGVDRFEHRGEGSMVTKDDLLMMFNTNVGLLHRWMHCIIMNIDNDFKELTHGNQTWHTSQISILMRISRWEILCILR